MIEYTVAWMHSHIVLLYNTSLMLAGWYYSLVHLMGEGGREESLEVLN